MLMQQEVTVAATSVPPSRTTAPAPVETETVIEPSRGWIGVNWREMFRGRELLYFLVWRDIKVRYKQALLGIGWAVLQPVLSMTIFTLLFGVGFTLRKDLPPNVPFPVFVFCGLLPWQLFATAMSLGGMSLVSQQNLLTKIYFPRLFVPTSIVGGALVDMAISFGIVAILFAWYHLVPPLAVVFLPLLILLTIMIALGVSYLLSALTVTYRDFRFLIPFVAQIWMWLSFVAFPVPQGILDSPKGRLLLTLNPMYGIIAAYRRVLLGVEKGWSPVFLTSAIGIAIVVFVWGLFYFRKTEKRFADIA